MPVRVYNRPTRICETCGNEFTPSQSRQLFCSRSCFFNRRGFFSSMEEFFRAFCGKPTEAGCVEWMGRRTRFGHGIGTFRNQVIATHRYAYELAYGPIPNGLHVLHHCDNPPCVNPSHLFLGTEADNVRDKTEKGRQAKGTEIVSSKLNPDKVRAIRIRIANGETQASISKDFGVVYQTIALIAHGSTWKSVT